jgi:hypothetical protein
LPPPNRASRKPMRYAFMYAVVALC